jgi:hypothetical protein
MSKFPKIPGAPHRPPAPPAEQQVSLEQLAEIGAKSIPLSTHVGHGGGVMLDPSTMSVYVIGKHPLALDAQIVRVPFSAWMSLAAALVIHMIAPSFAASEKALAAQRDIATVKG